jgi:hypothetical protein
MRKVLTIALVLALSATITSTASAATKKSNSFSVTQKIVYVGLTPQSEPDFWTSKSEESATAASDGDMLAFAKVTVSNAATFWKRASSNKLKFGTATFFIGKAGTAIKRCNSSADIKAAMKIAGMKSIPVGTHLVVANTETNCGWAGLGAQRGNTVSLASLSTTTLVHELGHNFGFLHSSALYCKNSDFKNFNSKNCSVDEYGDFRDLMGNDEWCPNATLSATQRATVFGTPLAKELKLGAINTVDQSSANTDNLVYELNYKGVWYFFEYYNPGRDRCMTVSSISYTPEIQVRMIGPDWTTAKLSAAGPAVISREEEDLPAPVIIPTDDGVTHLGPAGGWTLRGFKAGETFQLPGTTLQLKVLTTDSGSATFSVSNG